MAASSLRREIKALRAAIEAATPKELDIPDPVAWAESVSGFSLDEWQKGVLRSNAKRLMLLCSRQSGKSEIVSLLAATIAIRGGAVIVVAPSLRQSSNLFRRMRGHLQRAGARFTRETTTEIALAGNGWATCLPGDRPSMLRGLSLRHTGEAALLIDECAYVKDELWPVASPMAAAAPNARIILLSTPCGPVGEFHRIWQSEDEPYERVTVTAADCPRISPAFLEEEKRRLGVLFEQEYMARFIASGNSVFSADVLAAMFNDVSPEEQTGGMSGDWSQLLFAEDDPQPISKFRAF